MVRDAGRKHLREKRRSGLVNKKRFFDLISANSNHIDPEIVELVYLGLVKTVSQELRNNQFIRLPFLADIALKKLPPHYRPVGNLIAGQKKVWFEDLVTVRFYPVEALSRYFHKLGKGIMRVER